MFAVVRFFLSCPDRANTNYIVKYNLQTEREEAQIAVPSDSGWPRRCNYQWGGYSGVDLAVDEQGLWVLFCSTKNSYQLRAAKIDVKSNSIGKTWNLNTGIRMQRGHKNKKNSIIKSNI